MDAPSGFRQSDGGGPSHRGPKKLGKKASKTPNPQLFTDVSQPPAPSPQGYAAGPQGYYPQQPQQQYYPQGNQMSTSFPGQQYLNDPMASMAVQYGGNLAGQGKEYVQQNLEKYVSASKIKYYFAVDTAYVGKKLGLLLFPFSHNDWSVPYNQDEPVQPRYALNAPDLYIPAMGFVTYILLSAVALGLQGRFTPETIGMSSSTALGYLVLEILLILLSLYIMVVQTPMGYLDWTAYCGYKYFGMVITLIAGAFINKMAYFITLTYLGLALAFFMTRSLKVQILPHSDEYTQQGNKRRLYVLIALAFAQPVLMWWLTYFLI